jgi:site-specific DNA-cytosine methylase
MTLTITDIFAGAGGSTSGATMVPGVEVRVAANHWQMAVDVHQINHPRTDHACVDLHLEDPRNFPTTDILWASPESTKTLTVAEASGLIDHLQKMQDESINPTTGEVIEAELVDDPTDEWPEVRQPGGSAA